MRRAGTVGKDSQVLATRQDTATIHTFRRTLGEARTVHVLVALYALHGHDYVEIARFMRDRTPGVTAANGGLFPRLRFWGLVECRLNEEGEEVQGWWRVTDLGSRFVRGDVKLPRCVGEEKTIVVVPDCWNGVYWVQRYAGWRYDFDGAQREIRRLADAGESILGYFDKQYRACP